jgi:DNA-3-methyladenine glycosylase
MPTREPRIVPPSRDEALPPAPTAMKLARAFYDRPTLTVAGELLGKVLVHRRGRATTSGAIVEVEAYIGESDPACHAAPGPTPRNAPLYGPPGFSYVYLNYGIHALVNIVTEGEGSPAAVLIRALAPLDGIALMAQRRRRSAKGRGARLLPQHPTDDLCRGPGNLTMAMAITLDQNRVDLQGDRLWIEDRGIDVGQVVWTPRIGIRVGTDRLWRAHIEADVAVSGPRRRRAPA